MSANKELKETGLQPQKNETVLKHGMEVNHRYMIDHLIGRGGYGEVYRGVDQTLGREVAIKILYKQHDNDAERQRKEEKRFVNEARITAQLLHSSLPITHDFGKLDCANEEFFIVSELLKGYPLSDRISISSLSVVEALELMVQSAGALSVAHARGVLHRDLKPSNIFCVVDPAQTSTPLFKVLDFGIAKVTQDSALAGLNSDETREGLIIGTPRYMAPERLQGQGYGPPSDIYGLGVIFYKALTQELPYQGDNIVSLLLNQMNGPPPLIRLEGYTDDQLIMLQRFFEGMTHINPESRLQTAKEVVERAKALLIDFSRLKPHFLEKPSLVPSPSAADSNLISTSHDNAIENDSLSADSQDGSDAAIAEFDHSDLAGFSGLYDDFGGGLSNDFGGSLSELSDSHTSIRPIKKNQSPASPMEGERDPSNRDDSSANDHFFVASNTPTPSNVHKVAIVPKVNEPHQVEPLERTIPPSADDDPLSSREQDELAELFPVTEKESSFQWSKGVIIGGIAALCVGAVLFFSQPESNTGDRPRDKSETYRSEITQTMLLNEIEIEGDSPQVVDNHSVRHAKREVTSPSAKVVRAGVDRQKGVAPEKISPTATAQIQPSAPHPEKTAKEKLKERKRRPSSVRRLKRRNDKKSAKPKNAIKSVKLSLSPQKPTYLVGNQIKWRVTADGVTTSNVKITVSPAVNAKVSGQVITLSRAGIIKVTACVGTQCAKRKLIVYDDLFNDLE